MGFYQEDYWAIEFLLEKGYLQKGSSVIECGSQDLLCTREGRSVSNKERKSTREIFKQYGFKDYECIDMDGGHNSLQFDFGLDLRTEYQYNKQFDLVTCREFGHWIFDQRQMFENLHNLCKIGGYVIWRPFLSGAFGYGFYAYNPNKILHLMFANGYKMIRVYITEQIYKENGEFAGRDRKYPSLLCENGADFLNALDMYLDKEDTWRKTSLKVGIPTINPTIIWQKTEDRPFKSPLYYYDEPERTITRNAKSVLQNCFPRIQKGNVAIFGAARAGNIANEFAKASGLNVACVIDDYVKSADFCGGVGLLIVSFDEFVKNYQEKCDFILVGPCQSGEIKGREGLKIQVCALDGSWFV